MQKQKIFSHGYELVAPFEAAMSLTYFQDHYRSKKQI
jgi:hypothetical protein